MKSWKILGWAMVFALLTACEDEEEQPQSVVYSYEFTSDNEGWTGGFADYPVGEETFYELNFSYGTLPAPLDQTEGAIILSGNNHSDDLFMYATKKVSGLQANTTYKVDMLVEFATDVADNTAGVGGSPGESVYVKAGASTAEPDRETDNLDWYRMTIDKNNQSQSGDDMIVIGDFSNDTDEPVYVLKTVTNSEEFTATTNANGEIWLIVGTDSGFEATTTIHYNRIEFTFSL